MNGSVRVDLDDGLLTVVLDEPETRNALTPAVESGLLDAITQASDDSVRAVLLTATGSAFCGGGNLREMETNDRRSPEEISARARFLPEVLWRPLYELPKPVVVAVNGWAIGAGIALALAADIRVASDQARFRLGFSRVGLAPDLAAAWMLPRVIGLAAALELMLTDRILAADDARSLGLVHRVVAHEDLMPAATELARELAHGPTAAFAASKRLMQQSFDVGLDQAIVDEATTQSRLLQTRDHAIGVAAIRAKAKPRFEGF